MAGEGRPVLAMLGRSDRRLSEAVRLNPRLAGAFNERGYAYYQKRDFDGAKKLLEDAGQMDFEHDLITVEDDWQKNTGDAIAA